MADVKDIGGAKLNIEADSSGFSKVIENIMKYGEKLEDAFKKTADVFDTTITKAESLGKKAAEVGTKTVNMGNNATKSISDMKNIIDKTKNSVDIFSKSTDSFSKSTLNGYQKAGNGIKSVNASLSSDTKATFNDMKATNDDFNKNLVTSMKYSLGEVKSSFSNLKASFANIGSIIVDTLKAPVRAIQSIPDVAKTMGRKLSGAVSSGFTTAKDLALSQIEKIKTGVQSIPTKAKSAVNATKNFFVTGFNSVTMSASSTINKAASSINELPSKVKGSVTRFKDNFVNGIKDIPNAAKSMATNVVDKIKGISSSTKSVAGNIKNSFSDSFNGVKQKAKESIDNAKQKLKEMEDSGEKASLSIGKIAGAFGLVKAASMIIGTITSSIGSAISRFDIMEKYPKVMQSLGYTFDQAKTSIDALSAGIDGLPTKLDEIVATNQRMVSISGNVEKATSATIALNNAFLASGAGSDEAARGMDQYLKMLSTGKVEADSWQTLMETMPVSLSKVANALGYVGNSAMVDLQSALKDGTITFDQFQDKLIELGTDSGELAELAKINSQGIATSFGNLRNAVSKGVANVITELDKMSQKFTGNTIAKNLDGLKVFINSTFKSIVENIEPFFDAMSRLYQTIKPLIPVIAGVTTAVVAYTIASSAMAKIAFISEMIQGMIVAYHGLKLATDASTASQKGFNIVANLNPVAIWVAAIVGLIAVLVIAYKKSETFRNAVDKLIEPLKKAGKAISILSEAFKAMFSIGPGKEVNKLKDQLYNLLPDSVASALWNSAMKVSEGINKIKKAFEGIAGIISGKYTKDYEMLKFIPDDIDISWADKLFAVGKKLRGVADAFKAVGQAMQIFFAIVSGNANSYVDLFNLADGKLSLGQLDILWQFMEVFKQFREVVVKTFGDVKDAISKAFTEKDFGPLIKLGSELLPKIMLAIVGGFPALLMTGAKLISKLADGMGISIPELIEKASGVVMNIVEGISKQLPSLVYTGVRILTSVVSGIVKMLPTLIGVAVKLLTTIVSAIIEVLPIIIDAGIKILTALIDGIVLLLPTLIEVAITLINTIITIIVENLPMIIDAGIEILMALINGIVKILPTLIEAAVGLIISIVTALIENLPIIIDAGIKILLALIDGIIAVLPTLIDAAITLILKLFDALIENLPKIIEAGIQILVALIKGLVEAIPKLLAALPQIFTAIFEAFGEVDWLEIGKNIIDGVAKGIKSMGKAVKDAVTGVGDSIKNWFEEKLDINSPSKVMETSASWVPAGVASGIANGDSGIQTAMGNMVGVVTGAFSGISTMVDNAQITAQGIQMANVLVSGISSGMSGLPKIGASYINQFIAVMAKSAATSGAIGIQIGQGITRGIQSSSSMMNSVSNSLMYILNGNLRKYISIMLATGRQLMTSFISGFNSLVSAAQARANFVGLNTVNQIKRHTASMRSAGVSLMSGLAQGINSGQSAVNTAMRGVSGTMLNAIQKGINGVLGGVNFVMGQVGSETKVKTWTIPKYAKGTDGHPVNGPAIVNDASSGPWQEAYQLPNGKMGLFPKMKNLMVNLPKGAKVMTGKMVSALNSNAIPRYADGIGFDEDIFDYLDKPKELLQKAVDKKTDLKGITSPWHSMTKSAMSLMTDKAVPMVKREMDSMFTSSDIGDTSKDSNGVYSYLMGIARSLMKKYNLSFTSGFRPGDPYDHGKGLAVDIALPGVVNGSPTYKAAADDAIKMPGVKYVITNGMWKHKGKSWVPWPDGDHYDHVHISGEQPTGNTSKSSGGSGVERWRGTVMNALRIAGQLSPSNIEKTLFQMRTESNGDPRAINNWDINAQNGTPSKGLMQVIDPTFRAHAKAPHNKNIWDPLSNILASVRYAMSRYGSLAAAYRGTGYENGGLVNRHQIAQIAEGNKPEMIIPLTKPKRAMDLIGKALQFLGYDGTQMFASIPNVLGNMAISMSDKLSSFMVTSLESLSDSLNLNSNSISLNSNIGNSVDVINKIDEVRSVNQSMLLVLMQILDKDSDTYLSGKKVTDDVDRRNAARLKIKDYVNR